VHCGTLHDDELDDPDCPLLDPLEDPLDDPPLDEPGGTLLEPEELLPELEYELLEDPLLEPLEQHSQQQHPAWWLNIQGPTVLDRQQLSMCSVTTRV
jgi:hypothetical protein